MGGLAAYLLYLRAISLFYLNLTKWGRPEKTGCQFCKLSDFLPRFSTCGTSFFHWKIVENTVSFFFWLDCSFFCSCPPLFTNQRRHLLTKISGKHNLKCKTCTTCLAANVLITCQTPAFCSSRREYLNIIRPSGYFALPDLSLADVLGCLTVWGHEWDHPNER